VAAIAPLVGEIQFQSETHRPRGEHTQIYVFHNRLQSAALYEPVGKRLLPLDAKWRDELIRLPWPGPNLPQILGDSMPTLAALVREYLFISIYKACAESLASENGSRLAAMQRARREEYRDAGGCSESNFLPPAAKLDRRRALRCDGRFQRTVYQDPNSKVRAP
jgi:F-type H+-transporting ATPase subunit gamma